jgi:hypothetical protein
MTRHNHILFFSAFVSRPISLLASTRVFCSLVRYLYYRLKNEYNQNKSIADVPIQSQTDLIFLDFRDGIF